MNHLSRAACATTLMLGLWPAYGQAQYLPRPAPPRQFQAYVPPAPQLDPCYNSNAWPGMISWLNAQAHLPRKVVELRGLRTPGDVDFHTEGSTLVCFGQIVFDDDNKLVGWITVADQGPGQGLQVTWRPDPSAINPNNHPFEADQPATPAPKTPPKVVAASPCDAPPYGGTTPEFQAFVRNFGQYVEPTKILASVCNMKLRKVPRRPMYNLGLTDAEIDKKSTADLAIATIIATKNLVDKACAGQASCP